MESQVSPASEQHRLEWQKQLIKFFLEFLSGLTEREGDIFMKEWDSWTGIQDGGFLSLHLWGQEATKSLGDEMGMNCMREIQKFRAIP